MKSLRLLPLAIFLPLVACEVTEVPSSSSSSGGPNTPETPEPSCPTTTTGPTIHKGDVQGNEVWTAAASPHIVEYTVNVRNDAKLTIEPCAEVRVAKGMHINVAYPGTPNTGTLIAEGTAKRPIRFTGLDGARWASVAVHAPGTARFAHASFDNGGGGDFQEGATIAAYGDGEDGADPIVFMDHVSITKSLGAGAWIHRGATFIEGSRDLTIRDSGSKEFPYPIEIEEHAVDALPTGSYTGNFKDEILLDPRGGRMAGSGFLDDATIHDRGVPYHVGRATKGQSLIIGGRPDSRLVTVTIEPGVVLKFLPESALKVQHFTTDKPSTGALRAIGTAAKPIILTSTSDAPTPGAWQGIWFGGIPGATNKIDQVRIEYAGGDCGCILNTCSNIGYHEGAIIFTAQPPSAFVTNTVFANSAGHAITQGYDGNFIDFRPTNSFEGVAGCEQTRPRITNPGCPKPLPACD